MANIENLKARARTIQVEVADGMNSSSRVGGLLYDMINAIEAINKETEDATQRINSVIVTPVQQSGVQVANITVDNRTSTLFAPAVDPGSKVSFTPSVTNGTVLGTITIDGVQHRIYTDITRGPKGDTGAKGADGKDGTVVTYSPSITSGTLIGTIYVDGQAFALYAPSGGDDGSSNVGVRQILKTGVPIADLTIDGGTVRLFAPENTGNGDVDTTVIQQIIGSSVSYTPYTTSGEIIGTLTINGVSNTLYAPSGSTGPSTPGADGKGIANMQGYYLATPQSSGVTRSTAGWTTSIQTMTSTLKYLWYYCMTTFTDSSVSFTDPVIIGVYGEGSSTPGSGYDDTAVKKAIKDLEDELDRTTDLANSEKERLDGVIDDLAKQVEDTLDGMLNDAEWIREHFPEGQTGGTSNFGEDNVEAYLQRIGVWARDNDVTKTNWSDISQKVDSIELSVNQLIEGEMDTEALRAAVRAAVEDEVASLDLSTMYAKKDAEKVIEWLYSGLKSRTSANRSFNELVSAGESAFGNAISEIRTQVDKLENGEYVAIANLAAKVGDSISELYSQASASEARNTLFSTIKQNSKDIAEIFTATTGSSSSAGIAARLAEWKAGLITTATLDGAIANLMATNGTTTSGLMLKSDLDSAKADIIAGMDGTYAKIAATVTKDANGNIESTAKINANQIYLSGTTWANIINFDTLLSAAGNDTVSITSSTINVYSQGYKGSDYTRIEPHTITLYQQVSGNMSGATLWAHGFSWQGLEYDKSTGLHFGGTSSNEYAATIWVNGSTCEFKSAQSLRMVADGTLYLTGSDIDLGTLGGDNATVTLALKAGEITASSPITTSSDERLKTIVSVLEPDIDAIAQVRIVDFYYNSDSKQTHQVGSIAQDWQEVLPLAVKTDKEGNLGLNYSTAALASAVTAAREIVALKAKMAELESKLAN